MAVASAVAGRSDRLDYNTPRPEPRTGPAMLYP